MSQTKKMTLDLKTVDLYELLEIAVEAKDKEIKKAYRKKALKVHPDKNPDNPEAAELFHQLSEALEILLDKEARVAYDKVLKARKAAEIRRRELDSKRLKLKDDLERREREAAAETEAVVVSSERLQAEIERLRKEGFRQLKEEQELMKQELSQTLNKPESQTCETTARLKVRWKVDDGYDVEKLTRIFNKYGDVSCVVISKSKKGSALVEMASEKAAKMAVDYETGLANAPLKVTWMAKDKQEAQASSSSLYWTNVSRSYESEAEKDRKRAEERQRLIDEILREEQGQT